MGGKVIALCTITLTSLATRSSLVYKNTQNIQLLSSFCPVFKSAYICQAI